MLNIAICDDDKEFIDKIIPTIKKTFSNLKIPACIHYFDDGNKLIKRFEMYDSYFDIIFLNVDTPNTNGIEIARKLRLLDKKFKLILITSYDDEILYTFQYDAIGLLPKLLNHSKISNVIERAVKAIDDDNPHFYMFKVKHDNGTRIIKIPLNDIIYFESINRKTYLHSKRETFSLIGVQFSKIIEEFIPLDFVDIHRTCIVNIKYIHSIENTEVILDNGTRLPMSRRKRQKTLNKFSEIISLAK